MESLHREIDSKGVAALGKKAPWENMAPGSSGNPFPPFPNAVVSKQTKNTIIVVDEDPTVENFFNTDPFEPSTSDSRIKQERGFDKLSYSEKRKAAIFYFQLGVWCDRFGILVHVTIMGDSHLANAINFIQRMLDQGQKSVAWGLGKEWLCALVKESERRMDKEGIEPI